MTISPGLQAFWDQERRQITDNIRRSGVHLSYVSDHLEECACSCCAAGDPGGQEVDYLIEVVTRVGGDPALLPSRLEVPFCYTTGLFGAGHAELVVLGLSPEASALLLNRMAHRILGHGQDLMPGELVQVEKLRVLVEELDNSGLVLLNTHDYYDRPPWQPLPAYQLTWADEQGRFPWDEGHLPQPWPQARPGAYRA